MRNKRAEVLGSNPRTLRAVEKAIGVSVSQGGDLRVHLAYPNEYWVAMSNLGFQAVFSLFAKESGVTIERAFLPEKVTPKSVDDGPWRTFESNRLLADCDILGFSLSFETDYPHLLQMLGNAGLLYASAEERERAVAESAFATPLIIAGGTAVTLNPEPVANFIDVIVVGEAEELIPEFSEVIRRARSAGLTRVELLRELAQIEGVYVPRFYSTTFNHDGSVEAIVPAPGVPSRPKRRFVKDLSKFPTYTRVLTPHTEFKSMFLTETGRGCEMGCRFCVAGYIYRPVRKRSEESIADTVKIGLENSDAVGFVGAAVSSHRSIAKLARSVADQGGRASLSSLMSQKVTRELAGSLSESEYKTVALAPEAGNNRLRRALGKRVTDAQVIEAALALADAGIRGFKLYFMVGLPTEIDDDVDSIARLSIAVRDAVHNATRASGRVAWVQLSVNPFIPKASTPFQWEPMVPAKELESKIDRIRALIRKVSNLEIRFETPKESIFQALLSRGDRRVGQYLWTAYQQREDWKWIVDRRKSPQLEGVPPVSYYVERRIDQEELLPWEVIDSRIDKKLLLREAGRAHDGDDADSTPVAFEDEEQGAVRS